MPLFDRVMGLFGKAPVQDEAEQRLVAEMTDVIVETVEPRLRANARYRQRLQPCVCATMAYLREIGRSLQEPLLLTRANWNTDPRLHAFFGRADDVPEFLGRSRELRAFFDGNLQLDQGFALLGMRKVEKTSFGTRFEDGLMKQDVAQTTVDFVAHRLLAPSPALPAARREIGQRVIARLAQVTLGKVLAQEEQALGQERQLAQLGTRLRMLKHAQEGMQGLVEDPAKIEAEIREVLRQRDEAEREAGAARGGSPTTLDTWFGIIEDVFSHPQQHVALTREDLHLSRMSVKVDAGAPDAHDVVPLLEMRIGDKVDAVVIFVQVPRAELPPKQDLLAKAERFI